MITKHEQKPKLLLRYRLLKVAVSCHKSSLTSRREDSFTNTSQRSGKGYRQDDVCVCVCACTYVCAVGVWPGLQGCGAHVTASVCARTRTAEKEKAAENSNKVLLSGKDELEGKVPGRVV